MDVELSALTKNKPTLTHKQIMKSEIELAYVTAII